MKNPPAIPSVPADFGLTKNKDYTPQQLTFLEELCNPANQGNIRTAMDAAGYSKNTKPHMIMANLKEEIIERTQLLMALHAPKATMSVLGLLDEPNALGAKNIIAASKEILDRAGVVKKESVELKAPDSGGIFILPPKLSS